MSERINIAGLDKGAVLKALHDGTKPLRMGFLQAVPNLTLDQAQRDYETARERAERYGRKDEVFFDYYYGRPLKVNIAKDELDPILYDRDAGPGAAAKAIAALREQEQEK